MIILIKISLFETNFVKAILPSIQIPQAFPDTASIDFLDQAF
jgi:hypothetical protein